MPLYLTLNITTLKGMIKFVVVNFLIILLYLVRIEPIPCTLNSEP